MRQPSSTARWTPSRGSRAPSKPSTGRCRGPPPRGPELVHFRTNRFAKKNPALSARLGRTAVDPDLPPAVACVTQDSSAVASGEGGLSGIRRVSQDVGALRAAASVDVPTIPSSHGRGELPGWPHKPSEDARDGWRACGGADGDSDDLRGAPAHEGARARQPGPPGAGRSQAA